MSKFFGFFFLFILVVFCCLQYNINIYIFLSNSSESNCIGGVTVSVFVSSTIVRGFELQSGQIKDLKLHIYCLYAMRATFRSKSK